MAFLAATSILGGWNIASTHLIWPSETCRLYYWYPGSLQYSSLGAFWLIAKAYFGMLVQMWVRWTFPRQESTS
ncbi:MAG: NADH-quinone oxidoreductase subunit H [Cytophagaceae bacterium]|nr:NADH-quinone oxidoreductase subunit H [Cytophagaceae bacterium]